MSTKQDYSGVVEILEEILGKPSDHNEFSGQMRFDCPVCSYDIKGLDEGDGKYNLEVNYKEGEFGVFKCWVCCDTHETHGSVKKLIRQYGTKKQLKDYEILRPDDVNEFEKKKYQRVKIPKDFILFEHASPGMKLTPYYKQAIKYLKKRNVTDELIKKFRIGFCYQGEFAHRIIIPSFDKDYDLNYFIARSYLTKPYTKYKNPKAEKDVIIFNEHLIDWDKKIYIVEGAFDSIFLPNAIPMLGKHMSSFLFNVLYEKAKEIIIVLDPDAWDNAVKLYHELNCGKLYNKIWIVHLSEEDNKDIAELCGDLTNYEIKKLE